MRITIRRRTLDSYIGLDILMNGEKIKIVDASRNLGLAFNDNLTGTNHVNTHVGQIYRKLRYLWSTQYFIPLNISRLIAKCYLFLVSCRVVNFLQIDIPLARRSSTSSTFNNIVRKDHVSHCSFMV